MKLATPLFERVIEMDDEHITSIVIEDQACFRDLVCDISAQVDGLDGSAVLSINNKLMQISKSVEILQCFAPFDMSRKPLLSKLINTLDQTAADDSTWLRTQELLVSIEKHIAELAIDLPCGVECGKLTFAGILKSVGITIYESSDPLENVLNYMELVRELDGERLFIAINMRSWFTDKSMNSFVKDVVSKKLRLLLLESCERPILTFEKRYTVDADRCEF